MITKRCQQCNKEFTKPNWEMKERKFCSINCFYLSHHEFKHSDKTKRKMRLKRLGIKYSEETKMKMSISANKRKGRYISEETKMKIGDAQRGDKNNRWKGGKKAYEKRVIEKRKNNLKWQLNNRLNVLIRRSLIKGTKNKRKKYDLLNYNYRKLKKHLNSTMPNGFTWQDFLDGKLHIDHIIPISAFNFDKPEHLDFKRCWALNNLQLLSKGDNIKKSNKINHSFQPSLKL